MKERHQFPAELSQLSGIADVVKTAAQRVQSADLAMFLYAIELSVHEACVNIIEHSYDGQAGKIELLLDVTTDCFQATLRDWGRPFDPNRVPSPDLNVPQVGGYGLFLINELMDECIYSHENGCNQLMMKKVVSKE